ncbi:site-specific DNA-methyltransferase [Staphylococcus aureus]|uniref:site-specific DNA-methyltransferase n=1 Tax=Staphylococcus aureus TaxID=1280 RepID=UPI002147DDDF|nr:site-specific DNA-methyltransferase [Staphylococcus aureus]MCQ9882290.1 site-specific DNA-methyltransferase [Staphylococcus aureus]WEH51022.1 site-specific DNA-methyltransferase [Staphylococcus aureus]
MNKMPSSSLDLTKENVEKLKELFPEILTDGEQIDFDKLKTILGQEVNGEKERYSFNWHGKKDAILGAQKPSKGTLRPDKDKSKNFDTTENLYIEGDNLEVLKLLQKSYSNKIKMIYIDPPYNTGNDFVYKDDFRDSVYNYLEQSGQVTKDKVLSSTNSETNGRYHTHWLNMMYPRLKLARTLLTNDGAIFISIDDNEYTNLKKICDEIFGEKNYRNTILVRRRVKSLNLQFSDNLKSFNVGAEYILVYSKNNEFSFESLRVKKQNFNNKGKWNVFWSGADRPTMRYDILGFTPTTGQWRWSKELADEAIKNYEVYINDFSDKMTIDEYWKETGRVLRFIRRIENGTGKNGGVQYYVGPNETSMRTSSWLDLEVSQISKEIDLPFENPKNKDLIKELIKSVPLKNGYILDFFSGSATTAHATMQLNVEDGGNRKFIMVQLPEMLDEKSEAYKDGYRTICDIGEERIRRAGELVKQELIEKNNKTGMLADNIVDPEQLDIGFKVLKLDKSNIREWNSDFEDLEDNLFAYEDVFVEGRSELDVVYEIMLKNGLDLTYKVNQFEHAGRNIYDVAYGNLFVCLADDIDVSVAQGIINKRNEYGTDTSSVVFKDAGFKSDADKLNVIELLKDNGYPEENILSI